MSPRLLIHNDANEDLDDLWERAPEAAADTQVAIEELAGSEGLLRAMSVNQARFAAPATGVLVQVARLVRVQFWGRNLWRLKLYELSAGELSPYRLIYGWLGEDVHLLAVMHRDQNYEQDDQLLARIKHACRGLGISTDP